MFLLLFFFNEGYYGLNMNKENIEVKLYPMIARQTRLYSKRKGGQSAFNFRDTAIKINISLNYLFTHNLINLK